MMTKAFFRLSPDGNRIAEAGLDRTYLQRWRETGESLHGCRIDTEIFLNILEKLSGPAVSDDIRRRELARLKRCAQSIWPEDY